MRYPQLLRSGPPCFYLKVCDDSQFADLRYELSGIHEGVAVCTIRGRKSRTLPAFFNEIGASLQFPYYFGENFNALDECLTDLDWMEADVYVVMVSNAELLLNSEDREDFNALMRSFMHANEEWHQPTGYDPRNPPPTPFHVVFQCEPAGIGFRTRPAQTMIERLTKAQAAFELLAE